MRFIDLANQKFGRLRAIKLYNGPSSRYRWVCQCSCGNTCVVISKHLTTGHTQSCGCFQREQAGQSARTHGQTQSPEYHSWYAMKSRCSNNNRWDYKYYGGRGIAVCKRWQNSFKKFLADMGKRPSPRHSLDRYPNPDGDYSPSNCRWATRKQQRSNQRRVSNG
jgi:hypothetical protein